MGLNLDYFYSLTPREFYNISKGWRARKEGEERLSWEQTRSIMFTVASPNLKKKNLKITEFMPFPWEKLQKEKKKLSESELKTMFERWDKAEFKSQK